MMSFFILIVALFSVTLAEVVLVSFDGVKETTSTTWTLTDDPVMGGLSYSNWTVDSVNQKGVWSGKIFSRDFLFSCEILNITFQEPLRSFLRFRRLDFATLCLRKKLGMMRAVTPIFLSGRNLRSHTTALKFLSLRTP